VIIHRQLKRRYAFFRKLPSCLVGIEACASLRRRWSQALNLMEVAIAGAVDREKNLI